jgi:hypothetical protein
MMGIWTGGDEQEWVRFKAALDGFGNPKRITSERTKQVIFLDLHISINKAGKIEIKNYMKPMTLHLYSHGLYAHPNGCLIGTIFGKPLRYWQQKTHISEFKTLMANFATHLKNRGHTMTEIEKNMLVAAK